MRQFLLLLSLVLLGGAAAAQEAPAPPSPAPVKPLEDQVVTTKHKAAIGGASIAYTASAGTLVLRDEEGKAKASMFFVAYTRDGVQDLSKRPVTFAYNGGPGSSSVGGGRLPGRWRA